MISSTIDVAIVGAGPIGLSMAIAVQQAGLQCAVFEAGQVGNTIAWWAPQTRWFSSNDRISLAGVPLETTDQSKATREQYLTYLRSLVRQFNIPVYTDRAVQAVTRKDNDVFQIDFSNSSRYPSISSRFAVLATGGTDIPNRLNIPGEDLPHVDGYFREPHRYFNRKLVIIGGRNSAVEAALRATQCGAHVTLCYRREDLPRQSIKYWLLPEMDGYIKSGRIQAYFESIPVEITPTHVLIQRSEVAINQPSASSQPLAIEADHVLTLIGYQQDKRLFHASGVRLVGESQRPEFDPESMETNIPGLFVIGTAVAGTQSSRYKIFLENCHSHIPLVLNTMLAQQRGASRGARIVQSVRTTSAEFQSRIEAMPES